MFRWLAFLTVIASSSFAAKIQIEKLAGQTLKLEGEKKALSDVHKYIEAHHFEYDKDGDKHNAVIKLIDAMKSEISTGWVVDAGGATFVTDRKFMTALPYVSDTMADSMPYAVVDLPSGWMVSASNSEAGGAPATATGKENLNEHIKRITLFSKPTFSGQKLNEWAQTAILNGVPELTKLRQIDEFKNSWGYVYFNFYDEPKCSSNIICNFKDSKKRLITVNFK